MLTVLHVITTINRGGAENHLYDLVKNQKKEGLKVVVAYLKGDGYWYDSLNNIGVKVYNLGMRRYGNPIPFFKINKICKEHGVDIVHSHLPPAELYVRIALLFGGCKRFFISKHNDTPFYRFPGGDLLGRWVASKSEKVIAISEAVKINCISRRIAKSDKIQVIYYGLDPEPYINVSKLEVESLRKEWLSGGDGVVIGTVARLVKQKALHVLLESYALYTKKSIDTSKLVIVGSGVLEKDLKQRAKELEISDKVVWTGFRDDIEIIMNSFDVFALTSLFEGFGLVLLEAMASSKPIVATKVSSIPEIVVDGKTGLLSPVLNPMEFSKSLYDVFHDKELANCGGAGYKRLLKCFTIERMTKDIISLYTRIEKWDA